MGITVVGLGPSSSRQVTKEAWDLLTAAELVYLRTSRHPVVDELAQYTTFKSFDHYYESAESFEEVYGLIVDELIRLEKEQGQVIYAVPGHPFVAESTVTALTAEAARQDVPVKIVSGLSFVEPVLAAVGVDGLNGLQLFDAIEVAEFLHPPVSGDTPVLLGQVYSRMLASELKLVLAAVYPDQHLVHLVHAAGSDEELVESIPMYEIDRSERVSHLTSLYIPPLPYNASLPALAETVAVLRSPEGCPWDQEQTPKSMRSGFLEEAAEVLDAIDHDDNDGLCEELGDVLYHVIMQVQMASEEEQFRLSDVIGGIEAKLKRRHPHVWGDWEVKDSAEVLRNWELLKKDEKKRGTESLLMNVPNSLPALARSQKIQDKVAEVGFDWPEISGVFDKLQEEVEELRAAETPEDRSLELGDILFVLANLARWLDIDAESSLREANLKFERRFRRLEQLMQDRQLAWSSMDLPALDKLWEEVKAALSEQA